MTRGNQRDLARAKNLKKQQDVAKAKKNQGDPSKRMESDAEIMRRKQQEAEAKKAAAAAAGGAAPASASKKK